MISLIICSRKSDISNSLKENIERTIGTDYELIVIDNSTNKYSIFSAYNEGVRRSKGDILCFMHEDILYHTNNWGISVYKYFGEDKKLGLLGVSGGCYLPKIPCYWHISPFLVYKDHTESINSYQKKSIFEVAACDGLWFCISKNLFDHIDFDEDLYFGFHYYDMDICMQVLFAQYKVCVCDFDIEHHADCRIDDSFYKNQQLFFDKWNTYLPIYRGINESDLVLSHIENLLVHNYSNDLLIDKLMTEKQTIQNSLAYRIGKKILFPFSFVRNYIVRR
jgi:glycosyltransferase involved in cell wall biosynthesis